MYTVVAVGVTTIVLPVKAPGFHVYEVAPVLVNVAVLEEHKIVGLLLAVRLIVDTFTLNVPVPLHPFISVPVTEYVVVTVGDTATLDPVKAPGFQVYVEAPVAVNVEPPPEQIAVGEAKGVTVTDGLTVIAIVFVVLHPLAPSPTTV